VSDLPWYFPDIMPTLAELAGVSEEVPEDIDGISIVPALTGQGEQTPRKHMYWHSGAFAIRVGHWKGLGRPDDLALYDLSFDIAEDNDLSAKHPEIVEPMEKYIEVKKAGNDEPPQFRRFPQRDCSHCLAYYRTMQRKRT